MTISPGPSEQRGDVNELVAFYDRIDEGNRLDHGEGRVELLRTREILRSELPPSPAVVLDVGGADGAHAGWLSGDGYDVAIVDPVQSQIARARSRGLTAEVGDARSLNRADESVDVVLVLGPLYHLQEASERRHALDEAHRVLRPGGVLAAAAVSRMAVPQDWLRRGLLDGANADAAMASIVANGYDTTTRSIFYFHTVAELRSEVEAAGFHSVAVRGLEGPAWAQLDPDCAPDDPAVLKVVRLARLADVDETVTGASAHLLALGRKQAARVLE